MILATKNTRKIKELKYAFPGAKSLGDLGMNFEITTAAAEEVSPGFDELMGRTAYGRALKKAVLAYNYTGQPAVADEENLVVHAFQSPSGLKRAIGNEDEKFNVRYFLDKINQLPDELLTATAITLLVYYDGDMDKVITGQGLVHGEVLRKSEGEISGFDSVFSIFNGKSLPLSNLSPEEKGLISPRGMAALQIKYKLERQGGIDLAK